MESQATYSATPQSTTPADKFISNEVFDFDSVMLTDNDLYSQEFAVVSDSFQGQNPAPDQTKFTFIYNDLESWLDLAGSFIRVKYRLAGNEAIPQPNTNAVPIPDVRSIWEQVVFTLGGTQVSNCSKDFWAYAQLSNKFWSYKFINKVGTMMGIEHTTRLGDPGLENCLQMGYNDAHAPGMNYMAIMDLPTVTGPGKGGIVPYNTTFPYYYNLNGVGELQALTNTTIGIESNIAKPALDYNGSIIVFWMPLATLVPFCQAYPRCIKGSTHFGSEKRSATYTRLCGWENSCRPPIDSQTLVCAASAA